MVEIMSGVFRARRRIRTAAVATALCTMLFATFLTATELPAKANACCAAMQHDCSGASMAPSCCAVSSAAARAVMPAKPADQQGPVGLTAVTLPHAVEHAFVRTQVRRGAMVSPSPPGVPTYLFVSSFRI
jgi:hypothetical protein